MESKHCFPEESCNDGMICMTSLILVSQKKTVSLVQLVNMWGLPNYNCFCQSNYKKRKVNFNS